MNDCSSHKTSVRSMSNSVQHLGSESVIHMNNESALDEHEFLSGEKSQHTENGYLQEHIMEFQEKREKAIKFIEDIVQRTLYYSQYIHNRILSSRTGKPETPARKKRKRSHGMNHSSEGIPHPLLFTGGVLHPHQLEGYQWLKTLFENGVNSILADEMGLGKTAQAIAIIAYLIEKGVHGPFLICAPLSTLQNWYMEFQKFAPEIPVVIYHGEKSKRQVLAQQLQTLVKVRNYSCVPVFITAYHTVLSDCKALSKVTWKYFVIDEGHRVKNHECKLFGALKMFRIAGLLIMTGTPLQNNLSELWALLHLALPQIFNDLAGFQSVLDLATITSEKADEMLATEEQNDNLVTKIHQVLTPFILRRTKADVNLPIPPKKEILVYAPLTTLQETYYRAIIDKTIDKVLKGESATEPFENDSQQKRNRKAVCYQEYDSDSDDESALDQFDEKQSLVEGNILPNLSQVMFLKMANVSMMLRKTTMHPYLICSPTCPGTAYLRVDEDLVRCSGKLRVLDAMLPHLKIRGHKVLIFSQMVKMLNLIEDYCIMRKFNYNRIDGSCSIEDRIEEMKKFNESSTSFLFLLSTRAGGLGVNLTSADTVIIYDSDWNPQSDLQAQDRCHRIGQTKPVVVYRFVCKNTVDEYMVDRAAAKRKLEKLIIKEGCFSTNDTLTKSQEPITKEEFLELLHSCDIEEAVECNEKEVLSRKDLNLLLDRSSLEKKVSSAFKIIS